MRTRAIILAVTMLLVAAVPAIASNQWPDDLPSQIGKCQKLPPSAVIGGLPRLLAYFTPQGMTYGIKTDDGKTFNLYSQPLGSKASVPIQSGISLNQVKRILETKCSE
ncbi:hypothetical protein [Maridesulfovibrio sp.]|uniref:hypothetical protein n=1 Tax=Maridesulfovibrio sp. TaxID=2795000 RepID=UPI003BAC3ABA